MDWETIAKGFEKLPTTRANVTIIDGELRAWSCYSGESTKAARKYGNLAKECDSRPYGWESSLWERFPDFFNVDTVTEDSEGRLLEFRTVEDVGELSQWLALELAKGEADSPVVEAEEPTREASRITSPTELRKLLGIDEHDMSNTKLVSLYDEGTLTKVPDPNATSRRFRVYLDSPALTQHAVDKLRDRNSS